MDAKITPTLNQGRWKEPSIVQRPVEASEARWIKWLEKDDGRGDDRCSLKAEVMTMWKRRLRLWDGSTMAQSTRR